MFLNKVYFDAPTDDGGVADPTPHDSVPAQQGTPVETGQDPNALAAEPSSGEPTGLFEYNGQVYDEAKVQALLDLEANKSTWEGNLQEQANRAMRLQ
jgi:hypothetical protein